jgi:hypothetical protein
MTRVKRRAPEREATTAFYIDVLTRLTGGRVPFLIGGTFAYGHYTGTQRATKDLDVFVRRSEVPDVLALFRGHGFRADLLFPHWLAKVRRDKFTMDIVFNSGNGCAPVDDEWFNHAAEGEILGFAVKLCPLEEMIWSKAFVMERERFDGADIIHLLRSGRELDWPRLLARFGEFWPVLLSHLILFSFVYPDRRASVPAAVMRDLLARQMDQRPDPSNRLCFGTLLSREQYLPDLQQYGYLDPRLLPPGVMTRQDAELWTAAIEAPRPGETHAPKASA